MNSRETLAVFDLPWCHPKISLLPSLTPCEYLWAVMLFPLSHQFFEFHQFSFFSHFLKMVFSSFLLFSFELPAPHLSSLF